MRIRGLVKASNRVREQLKIGIPSHEISAFRQYVEGTIQATDQICAQARIKPSQLPVPSRNAYRFLKGVNLNRLPIVESDGNNQSSPKGKLEISIQGIRSQLQYFQDRIADLSPDDTDAENKLKQKLGERTTQIEQLCTAQGATPGNLTPQSQQIYGWMKFLQQEDHLHLHAHAARQTKARVEQILANPLPGRKAQQFKALEHLRLEFAPMSALYRCQFKPPHLKIKINEGFILAEPEVIQAVLDSILLGKTPETTTIMTEYSLSEEFSELLLALDLMVEDLRDTAQGNVHNLDDVFARVNQVYFNQNLEKPRLAWSKVYSNRKFGHYEPSRDRVVISLSLDTDQLPKDVIEFVMYHELLHKVHGGRTQNERRRVHTPEFRRDERQFKNYSQALRQLEQLARKL